MSADDIVNRWILDTWVSGDRPMFPEYDPKVHGELHQLTVLNTDATWECGCYSEYTRDDSQLLTAKVRTKDGNVTLEYGFWYDIPEIISSLVDFGNIDDYCTVSDEDENER